MGYSKLIKSGNIYELYDYERHQSNSRNKENRDVRGRMERVRQSPPSERVGKRQDNAGRAKMAFGRLCASNFSGSEIAVYATFTFREEKSLKDGYYLFHLFTVRMRKKYGTHVRYIAVPEFGTRNTKRLHFHALLWNIPLELIKSERKTRYFAKLWKHGFIDLVETDNNPKLITYLSKYLSKSYKNPNLFSFASYSCSRNVYRPEFISSFVSLYLEHILPVDNLSLQYSKSYDTIWLGRCDYKIYNLNKNNGRSNNKSGEIHIKTRKGIRKTTHII